MMARVQSTMPQGTLQTKWLIERNYKMADDQRIKGLSKYGLNFEPSVLPLMSHVTDLDRK